VGKPETLMPIPLQCDCGRSMRVKDELAGRKVKCPQCAAVLTVPQPEPPAEDQAYELISDDGPEEEVRPRGRARSASEESVQAAPSRRRPAAAEDDEEDDPEERRRERRRRREREQDEEEEEDRRSAQRRREYRRDVARIEQPRPASRGFGSLNAGIVGGLLMIVIAIVWFGAGLMFGIIFFYPPILAIIGIGAIIKGLASR
jgi:hypothetical protein